jgi:hypothetical protein
MRPRDRISVGRIRDPAANKALVDAAEVALRRVEFEHDGKQFTASLNRGALDIHGDDGEFVVRVTW